MGISIDTVIVYVDKHRERERPQRSIKSDTYAERNGKWKGEKKTIFLFFLKDKTKLFIIGGRKKERETQGQRSAVHTPTKKRKKKETFLVDSLAAEQHSFEAPSAAYFPHSHTCIWYIHVCMGSLFSLSLLFDPSLESPAPLSSSSLPSSPHLKKKKRFLRTNSRRWGGGQVIKIVNTVEKSKRKAKFWNKPSRESSRVDTNARWARAFLYILPFFFWFQPQRNKWIFCFIFLKKAQILYWKLVEYRRAGMKLKRNKNWMGQRNSLIIRSIALELVVERTGKGWFD